MLGNSDSLVDLHLEMNLLLAIFVPLNLLCSGVAQDLPEVRLQGVGATFPSNLYAYWLYLYTYSRRQHVSLDVGYELTGSERGIEAALQESPLVDFSGSDILLQDADYQKNPDLQMIPVVAG